jgi:hypothetical protein
LNRAVHEVRHRIGFILVAMLILNSFAGALAIAQQDAAARIRVVE